jgi:hypothetical protein
MPVKLFTTTYVLGAIVFSAALLVIMLAAIGVNTLGKPVNLAIPIVAGFMLMVGSKLALRAVLSNAERR